MLKMRTVEITVGALMIIAIASFLMLALKVSGLSHAFSEDTGYKVEAEFSNIGGLKVRAKVSIAGVVVGRVTNIALNSQTYSANITLSLDPNTKIPVDSQARIMTSGLLGDNYIAIIPGFSETEFLGNGSVIPLESTHSALVLEELVSKFIGAKASEPDKNEPTHKNESNPNLSNNLNNTQTLNNGSKKEATKEPVKEYKKDKGEKSNAHE